MHLSNSGFIENKELLNNFNNTWYDKFKMNIRKILLAGDKFVPELHLRRSKFTKSVCGLFSKLHQRIQKFKETGNLKKLYRNELNKD